MIVDVSSHVNVNVNFNVNFNVAVNVNVNVNVNFNFNGTSDGSALEVRLIAAREPREMPEAEPARGQVETIADLHRASESRVGRHQRLIERLTARVGRPATLYALLGAVLAWCAFNLAAQHPPDPPPFTALQTLVTVASLLVTTMVLITQNRQARQAERRAQLDLHVNLQAEQKIAKLISLVEELRRDLPVRDRKDSEADAMSHAADPQAVLDALEESLDEPDDEPTPPPDETTG